MMKKINGSILIWSMVFMTFIGVSFLYVSTSLKNKILSLNNISNNSETYSEKSFINSFTGGLKDGEKLKFSFLSPNKGNIKILDGGKIFYKTSFSSGTIGDFENDIILNGDFEITNLSGYTKIQIDFLYSSGIIFPYNFLYEYQKIGNSNILKSVQIQ